MRYTLALVAKLIFYYAYIYIYLYLYAFLFATAFAKTFLTGTFYMVFYNYLNSSIFILSSLMNWELILEEIRVIISLLISFESILFKNSRQTSCALKEGLLKSSYLCQSLAVFLLCTWPFDLQYKDLSCTITFKSMYNYFMHILEIYCWFAQGSTRKDS